MAEDAGTENDRQRERLRTLGASLEPADWQRTLRNGWSVKAVFAHLGFWDRMSLVQLQRYRRAGVQPVRHEVEQLNAVVAALAEQLTPQQALEWASRCAQLVDDELRRLPPALKAEIEARDTPRRIHRHLHRREHLDKVEELLGP
jgi:hypothetical protein